MGSKGLSRFCPIDETFLLSSRNVGQCTFLPTMTMMFWLDREPLGESKGNYYKYIEDYCKHRYLCTYQLCVSIFADFTKNPALSFLTFCVMIKGI